MARHWELHPLLPVSERVLILFRASVRRLAFVAVTLSSSACGLSHTESPTTTASPDILPLRTLRLYETGVGYFERSGALGAHGGTSLPVPPGHLDDALASLVVLREGTGGVVTGLSFPSSVTKATARARAGLPADPDKPIAWKDLLESLRGEKVTIVTAATPADGEPTRGRVLEVGQEVDEDVALKKTLTASTASAKGSDDEIPKRLVVTLLTETGALTRVPADSILRIKPVDPAVSARLDEALDALGTRSARNPRGLLLLGAMRGKVTFGYVTETPIWRASYRLVEERRPDGSGSTAVLQGWALLHNDTDEDWRDVHLELVNGEPDSFLFPMAAPRYARRTLVHPENPLSTLPQLADTTADAMWGDHLDQAESITASGSGFGSGHGRLGGSHSVRSPSLRQGSVTVDGAVGASSLLDVGNLADLAPASGVEQGALFVYALPAGFSLEAHASALVPFLQRGVSAESVTYFAEPGAAGRVAVQFVNSTGQTLPTGTITVFGAGGFTGETSLDRLKPGERRFLQIGNDLDGEVTREKLSLHEESKRLTLEGDALHEHFLLTRTERWDLENRGGSRRLFDVVLDAGKNAKVTGADRVDFDESGGKPLLVFDVKAKEKRTQSLVIVEGLSRSFSLDNLTEKLIQKLLAKTSIQSEDRATLEQALPRVRAFEAGRTTVLSAQHVGGEADQALERLREDLKALGGGASAGGGTAAAPLVKRLVDAEDRVDAAQKAKEAAEKTLGERRDAVRLALATLVPPREK